MVPPGSGQHPQPLSGETPKDGADTRRGCVENRERLVSPAGRGVSRTPGRCHRAFGSCRSRGPTKAELKPSLCKATKGGVGHCSAQPWLAQKAFSWPTAHPGKGLGDAPQSPFAGRGEGEEPHVGAAPGIASPSGCICRRSDHQRMRRKQSVTQSFHGARCCLVAQLSLLSITNQPKTLLGLDT